MITVREILAEWLKAHGYDGLCSGDCGCGIDDLICCGGDPSECTPAKRVKITKKMIKDDKRRFGDFQAGDFIYVEVENGNRTE